MTISYHVRLWRIWWNLSWTKSRLTLRWHVLTWWRPLNHMWSVLHSHWAVRSLLRSWRSSLNLKSKIQHSIMTLNRRVIALFLIVTLISKQTEHVIPFSEVHDARMIQFSSNFPVSLFSHLLWHLADHRLPGSNIDSHIFAYTRFSFAILIWRSRRIENFSFSVGEKTQQWVIISYKKWF